MKSKLFLTTLLFLSFSMAGNQINFNDPAPPSIEGRWDITFDMNGTERPGWLEVVHSGHNALVGHILVIVGSVRPVSEVQYKNGKYSFTIPPQWERGSDLMFEMTQGGDRLVGTMIFADGKTYPWTGVRAPPLRKQLPPKWGKPIKLFNGKDLQGWITENPNDKNQWIVTDGILTSPARGANLRTEATFDDFKLHVECRYPKNGNSGVYLRGRYELQIIDSKDKEPSNIYFGAIYGAVAPSQMVARDPGEWQEFDITLIGRMLTVKANGVTIISNQEIPGITGGAIDSHEGEPGPILFQGDHEPIEFRNIVLRPGK